MGQAVAAAVVTKVGFREDYAGRLAPLPDEWDVWCETEKTRMTTKVLEE